MYRGQGTDAKDVCSDKKHYCPDLSERIASWFQMPIKSYLWIALKFHQVKNRLISIRTTAVCVFHPILFKKDPVGKGNSLFENRFSVGQCGTLRCGTPKCATLS